VSEWHSTTKLLEYLIRRDLKYPFRVRDTAGQENCGLISTVHLAFLERTEHTEMSEFKNGFSFTTEGCIFALIGGFTTCTVA